MDNNRQILNRAIEDLIAAWEQFFDSPDRANRPRIEDFLPKGVPPEEAIKCLLEAEIDVREQKDDTLDSPKHYLDRFPNISAEIVNRVCRRSVSEAAASDSTKNGRRIPDQTKLGGRYVIQRYIANGAMGAVYEVKDLHLGQDAVPRALKVAFPVGIRANKTDAKERLQKEARLQAKLRHSNIVPIIDLGDHDGEPYVVLDYIEGITACGRGRDRREIERATTLNQLLANSQGRKLRHDEAAWLVETCARAVAAAHSRHVIHRDLKPENILIAPDTSSDGYGYQPVVSDFGLARAIVGTAPAQNETEFSADNVTGVCGTPAYMAPEQCLSSDEQASLKITPLEPSDIWALGAILFEVLTGGRPILFDPTKASALLVHREALRTRPSLPSQPLIPDPDLRQICSKCLAIHPHDRYPSAGDLAKDLAAFRNREPLASSSNLRKASLWTRRHPAATIAAFAAAAIALVGVWSFRELSAKNTGLMRAVVSARIAAGAGVLSIGRLDDAIATSTHALDEIDQFKFDEPDQAFFAAPLHTQLGIAYSLNGNVAEAAKHNNAAVAALRRVFETNPLRQRVPEEPRSPRIADELAAAYLGFGSTLDSDNLKWLERNVDLLFKSTTTTDLQGGIYRLLADRCLQMNRLDEALAFRQSAVKCTSDAPDKMVARFFDNLFFAVAYQKKGEIEKSFEHLGQTTQPVSLGDIAGLVCVQLALDQAQTPTGDATVAARYLQQATSSFEPGDKKCPGCWYGTARKFLAEWKLNGSSDEHLLEESEQALLSAFDEDSLPLPKYGSRPSFDYANFKDDATLKPLLSRPKIIAAINDPKRIGGGVAPFPTQQYPWWVPKAPRQVLRTGATPAPLASDSSSSGTSPSPKYFIQ